MRLALSFLLLGALLLTARLAFAQPTAPPPQGHPCLPGNLIPGCFFRDFSGSPPRQIPSGWTPFSWPGSAGLSYQYNSDCEGCNTADKAQGSLRMWSDGYAFHAGVYTQVGGVQAGANYRASLWFGSPDTPGSASSFQRRIGIDPTGGTDPTSPNVVWGPWATGWGRILNYSPSDASHINIDVEAVAQSSTVTVYLDVNHIYPTSNNYILLDGVALYPDSSAPTPAPTATAEQQAALPAPTSAPEAAPTEAPSDTPAVALTITPTQAPPLTPTATVTPTLSPTASATLSPISSPTQKPTLTATPSATSTLPPRPPATAGPFTASPAAGTLPPFLDRGQGRQGLLFGGLGALAGAGVIGVVLARTRRR